jgi:hypothetical protein
MTKKEFSSRQKWLGKGDGETPLCISKTIHKVLKRAVLKPKTAAQKANNATIKNVRFRMYWELAFFIAINFF